MVILDLKAMKKVLSFAYLKKPQQEREQELKDAGLDVTVAATAPEALALLREDHFDVLIVGHAVPQEERDRVASVAKSRRTRVVFIYQNSINGAVSGDAVISADTSPRDLVETVKFLTA